MNPFIASLKERYKENILCTIEKLNQEIREELKISTINYQIPIIYTEKPIINLLIGNTTINRCLETLIDSGADINLLPGKVYDQLKALKLVPELSPIKDSYKISGVSGHLLNLAGNCNLKFSLKEEGEYYTEQFAVMYPQPGLPSNARPIIGYPFLRKHGYVLNPEKGLIKERKLIQQVYSLKGVYPVVSTVRQILIPGETAYIKGVILTKALTNQNSEVGTEVIISADHDWDLSNPDSLFLPQITSVQPRRMVQIQINHRNVKTDKIIQCGDIIAYASKNVSINIQEQNLIRTLTVLAQLKPENDPTDTVRQQLLSEIKDLTIDPKIKTFLIDAGFKSLVSFYEDEETYQVNAVIETTDISSEKLLHPGININVHNPLKCTFENNVDVELPEVTCKPQPEPDGVAFPEKLNPQFYDNITTPSEIPMLGNPDIIPSWEDVLSKVNCYHNKAKPQLMEIINKYKKAVSIHKYDLGKYNGEPVVVQIKEGSHPVRTRFRPTPPQLFKPAQKLLDQLQKYNIISKETSAYSSAARWVVKAAPDLTAQQCKERNAAAGSKDDTSTELDLRLTIDLRQLNDRMIYENHPLISPKKILPLIAKAKFCSTIDLPSAFYQLPLHKDSRKYFGFSANSAQYTLNRLSMGAKNSPQSLMTVLIHVLEGLEVTVLVYSDNLILLTEEDDYKIHVKLIETVFSRFEKYGLKLSISKSHFLISEQMQIFGHRINLKTKEIRPDATKVEKLRNLPFPVTRSLLKGFIGGVNFWTEILSNIAEPLSTLNSLLRNPGLPYLPGKEHHQAFERIKQKLTADNYVLLPDLEKTFYIFSDTGPSYSAGIIAQESVSGYLRPVIYFNKTLSPSESRFSQVEREGVGLISLLKSYQYLLQLGKICLFTDCRALSFIRQGSNSNLKLNRYSQYLALYDYKVFFLAARHPISKLVDVMSRPDEVRPKNMRFSTDIIEKIVIKPQLFWKYALPKGDLAELIQEGIQISQNGLDLTQLESSKNKQVSEDQGNLVPGLSALAVTRAQTRKRLKGSTPISKPDPTHPIIILTDDEENKDGELEEPPPP